MANVDHKIKLLILYDILCRATDEEHQLNTDEIIALLKEKGIDVSRKILREDIQTLNSYGYEVLEEKRKYFYYYVVSRQFESAEIALLTDVISSSKLNAGQKRNLIEKLANTLGSNRARLLLNNVVSFEKPKHSNAHIIYNIDGIERAISENKKVSFLYFSFDYTGKKTYRKDGNRYVVNPLVMIWDQDNYYLLSYDDKHTNTTTYRIDRMENVKVEDEERVRRADFENFDPEEYRTQVFSMFGGELKRVELQFSADMVNDIFDKFGEDTRIRKRDEDDYRATVPIQVSKTFFAWVVGSQGKVKIRSPIEVKEEFKIFVDKIKANY